ncbi:IclR family transcriptional regulator [Amycolatopsis pigmentata]|uniref:IclR family transcriptional regulator n=1 Tax=Amycolatopsis pigmentata TaxID=450801 RepID=A0ABW5FKR7_9PSEU
MAKTEGPGRADIQAVSRASRILGLFHVDRSELVTADVAIELGLNRTTTHRYLTSMASIGLLGPGSRLSSYVVGPLATKLGAIATNSAEVLSVAPRHMAALSDELGATLVLSLWASTGPMVVHVAEPRTPNAVLTIRTGTVLALSTAQGVVFTAFLPPGSSHLDQRRERLAPAARDAFDAEVEKAREECLSVSVRREHGVVTVAAPVFDGEGLCATVAVVGLVGSTLDTVTPERSRRIRELAALLTEELGGRVPEATRRP